MKYDLKRRIGHKDGWLLIGPFGHPRHCGWYDTRAEAREFAKKMAIPARIAKARSIVVWDKP